MLLHTLTYDHCCCTKQWCTVAERLWHTNLGSLSSSHNLAASGFRYDLMTRRGYYGLRQYKKDGKRCTFLYSLSIHGRQCTMVTCTVYNKKGLAINEGSRIDGRIDRGEDTYVDDGCSRLCVCVCVCVCVFVWCTVLCCVLQELATNNANNNNSK